MHPTLRLRCGGSRRVVEMKMKVGVWWRQIWWRAVAATVMGGVVLRGDAWRRGGGSSGVVAGIVMTG
ncbi:hypothetical protein Tco_1526802 [Tanacetum coccineum]